jgi:aspartate kinase
LVAEAKTLVQDICKDHIHAAESFVRDPSIREALCDDVKTECEELAEYIVATKRFNLEVNSRSKDRVISFGEKLSCRFMTALLRDYV